MRMLWATPFNIHSAIAVYSREVCNELARKGVSVEILRIEDAGADPVDELPSALVVHSASSYVEMEFLQDFDAIVVNLGDYAQFHLGALRLMAMIPVISIVHDSDLRHFVQGAVVRGFHIDRLASQWPSSRYYGSFEPARASEIALFASLSGGCVAHGSHYADLLRSACPGPVATIPLCYPDLGALEPAPNNDEQFVITTFGMINSNKQPERVMRAIASSERLRSVAKYRLVGPIVDSQRSYVEELAKTLDIRKPEILGRVSDRQLFEELAVSDVICCLRYPISEGGSASLITAVYSARPIIVSMFGSYADLPDDLFWKVSYGEDTADLAAALCSIEANRPAAERRIARLKAWAGATYSASAYVDSLLPLVKSAIDASPRIETGRSVGRILANFGVSPADPIVGRLDSQLSYLLESAKIR